MVYERFHELKTFNQTFLSVGARGNHSSGICAYWAGINGKILTTCEHLRVGIIQYFIRHTISVYLLQKHNSREFRISLLVSTGIELTQENLGTTTAYWWFHKILNHLGRLHSFQCPEFFPLVL